MYATCCGVAPLPASRVAGSVAGKIRKMRNVRKMTQISVRTPHSTRRIMNVTKACVSDQMNG